VSITGTGFDAEPTVTFGGVSATSVSFVSASRIDVVVPAHVAGPVAVVVRNADGRSATLESGYTYLLPPVVTHVSPAESRAGGGTRVTVFGSGFVAGASVSFGGRTAYPGILSSDGTSIWLYTPNHPEGVVSIVVTNPDQQSGLLENGHTFTAPTAIFRVTPNTGSADLGQSVVIDGKGFHDGMWVYFSYVPAVDVTFVSSTRLLATAPPRPIGGAVDVQLFSNWDDFYDAVLVDGFTYVKRPP
jgi:hypothetical protein